MPSVKCFVSLTLKFFLLRAISTALIQFTTVTVGSHGVAVIVGFHDDDVIDNDHYCYIAM